MNNAVVKLKPFIIRTTIFLMVQVIVLAVLFSATTPVNAADAYYEVAVNVVLTKTAGEIFSAEITGDQSQDITYPTDGTHRAALYGDGGEGIDDLCVEEGDVGIGGGGSILIPNSDYHMNFKATFSGIYTYHVYLYSPLGSLISHRVIQVTVTSSNTAPTFVGSTTTLTVTQDSSNNDIKSLLHASDTDSGQTLTWSQNTAPGHGTLSFTDATASSGSTNITPGGTITYTSTAAYSGLDSFTVQVSDGAETATRTINVTVTGLPEMAVSGGGHEIVDGDSSPDAADFTDFGSAEVDRGGTQHIFEITNTGSQTLHLDGAPNLVAIGGDNPGDFRVSRDPGSTVGINGGTTTFWIIFTPTALGVRNATISIDNDDTSEDPYNFSIRGTGVAAEISVWGNGTEITNNDNSPSADDDTEFGNADITTGEVSHTFTIKNTGTAALNLTGDPRVTVTGTDFTITTQPDSPVAVLTGETTFVVKFNPDTTGDKTATITISNNDINEINYTFDVHGTGNEPEINLRYSGSDFLTGSTNDFGTAYITGGSVPHTFTIQNNGTSTLNLTGGPLYVAKSGHTDDFIITQPASGTIGASSNTTFQVTFNPTAGGTRTAVITIASNDVSEPTYTFTVTGYAPFEIDSIADWQTLMAATTDWDEDYILLADINLAGITVTPVGNNDTKFTGDFDGNGHKLSNAVINGSANYVGVFGYIGGDGSVRDLGIENSIVNTFNDYVGGLAGRNEGTVTSCYAAVSVSATEYAGGLVGWTDGPIANCYATGSVTGLRYIGGLVGYSNSTVTNCFATGSVTTGFSEYSGLGNGLPADNSYWDTQTSGRLSGGIGTGLTTDEMTYEYSGGAYTGWDFPGVWLEDSSGYNNGYPYLAWQTFSINIGVEYESVDIASGDSHNFGSINTTSGSITHSFTITNNSNGSLHLTAVAPDYVTSTGHTGDFTITQPGSAWINAGGTATFQVTFDPTVTGARSAVFTIISNATNIGSFTFTGQGTGASPEMDVIGLGNSIGNGDAVPEIADDTDFGRQQVNTGSLSHTFTIRNTGTSPLDLTGASPYIQITGAAAGDYSVGVIPSNSIATGGTTTFRIDFEPAAWGARNATISIANTDMDENPYEFNITGEGTVAPVITNLAGNAVTFLEDEAAVNIDSGTAAGVTDADTSTYDGGHIYFDFSSGTANDFLGINVTHVKSGGDGTIAAGETIAVDDTDIGSVAAGKDGQAGNNLEINLTGGATDQLISILLQNVTYRNTAQDPVTSRSLDVTIGDKYDESIAYRVTITITPVNDPPTLNAIANNPAFNEGDAAKDLYSDITISTGETGQTITQLRITVTDVNNGASEIMRIDNTDVALTDGNIVDPTATGLRVTVSVTGDTATITIIKAGGISTVSAQTLVDGITYRNTSDNPLGANRAVTLTSIQDDGGTDNGGDDDNSLSITSIVALTGVNDPPALGNLDGDSITIFSGGTAGFIDQDSDLTITDVDSPDFNSGNVTIVLNSGSINGNFGVDGTNVTTDGGAVLAAGYNINVGGSPIGVVSMDGQGGNDLLIDFNGNATPARVQTLIRNLTYAATSTPGSRTFTISFHDGGGTAGGGNDSAPAGFTINVTPNPPVISNLNGDVLSYDPLAGGAALLDILGNATVTDPDNTNFNNGTLTVTITAGGIPAEDRVEIASTFSVSLSGGIFSGTHISVDGFYIGNITADSWDGFTVTFTEDATPARVTTLLRALTFKNFAAPDSTPGTRTVQVVIADSNTNPGTSAASTITINLGSPEINLKQGATDIPDNTGSYDYGNRIIGTATDVTFTIENTGSGNLTITIPLTLGGANANQFSIQLQPSAAVAASGNTTTFTVRFTPTSIGAKTAAIAIASDDNDENPYDLILTGTGIDIPQGNAGSGNVEPPAPNEPQPEPEPRIIAEVDTTVTPTATDREGNTLDITGDFITVTDSQATLTVNIPVALSNNSTLNSFTDAAGLTFEDNTLTIPTTSAAASLLKIIGDSGEMGSNIIIQTGDCIGTGSGACAEVLSITTESGYTVKDFTGENPSLGEVASTISLDLKTLPDGAEVDITTSLVPDPEAGNAFMLAAQNAGMADINIAYTINVNKTNLENGTDINGATIIMVVGAEWVDANGGVDAVRIIRYDPETGTRQVLETRLTGYDDQGRAIFEAFSPKGLSVFALVGAKATPPSVEPTPTDELETTTTPTLETTTTSTPTLETTTTPKPTPETTPTETSVPVQPANRSWIWVIIAIAAVVIGTGTYLIWRRRRAS